VLAVLPAVPTAVAAALLAPSLGTEPLEPLEVFRHPTAFCRHTSELVASALSEQVRRGTAVHGVVAVVVRALRAATTLGQVPPAECS